MECDSHGKIPFYLAFSINHMISLVIILRRGEGAVADGKLPELHASGAGGRPACGDLVELVVAVRPARPVAVILPHQRPGAGNKRRIVSARASVVEKINT